MPSSPPPKKSRQEADGEDSDGPAGSDEYIVERILDKRRNADGGTEYLIKWQGYPMDDSTWEAEENASCPDLIAAFEKERSDKILKKEAKKREEREKKREKEERDKRKSIDRREKSPSKGEVSSSTELFAAPIPDAKLQDILGITEKTLGVRAFVVKFTDGTCQMVSTSEANQKWPQEVIRFYETKIVVVNKNK